MLKTDSDRTLDIEDIITVTPVVAQTVAGPYVGATLSTIKYYGN